MRSCRTAEQRRRTMLAITIMLSLTTAVSLFQFYRSGAEQPKPLDGPAVTQIELDRQIVLPLGEGWVFKDSGDGGIDWYTCRKGISTNFRLTDGTELWRENMTGRAWSERFLTSTRLYLLRTFLEAPVTKYGPFLESIQPLGDLFVAQGYGRSNAGSLNHFFLILLPEQDSAVMIHSSTWDWDIDLEDYAQTVIQPLAEALCVNGQQAIHSN